MKKHEEPQPSLWNRLLDEAKISRPIPTWLLVWRMLAKSLLYGLILLRLALFPSHPTSRLILWSVVLLLWVPLLVTTVLDIRGKPAGSKAWRGSISDISLLIAPLFVLVGLPWLAIVLLVGGYMMQLRRISGGQIFIFASIGLITAYLLSSMALLDVEMDTASSPFHDYATSARYTLHTLFRLTGTSLPGPVTEDGQLIIEVVQFISAFLLGALYAGLLTLIVHGNQQPPAPTGNEDLQEILARQAEILDRLGRIEQALPPQGQSPSM